MTQLAMPFPQTLRNRDTARFTAYTRALDFYNGNQPVSSAAAARRVRQLTINYAKTIINKTASYLFGDRGPTYHVQPPPGASSQQTTAAQLAEDALNELLELNNASALDWTGELDAAILGDGCYKVTWDPNRDRVRITAPDVQGIYVWTAPDDLRQLLQVAHRYDLDPNQAAAVVASTGGTWTPEREKKVAVTERWTDVLFELWADNTLTFSAVNPYGVVPYLVWPNLPVPKTPWGESDLTAFRAPAEELNRAFSQLSRILELSGSPIAVLENVSSSEDIAVAPGAVWNLPEDAKAYLLELLGAGSRLHIDYIETLFRTLHDLAETPQTAFGGGSKALSGVALEIDFQPLIQKVARKRLARTELYQSRAQMALRILDQFTGTAHSQAGRVQLLWPPVLPNDEDQAVARESQRISSGQSTRKAAMLRAGNRDPDQEFAGWLDEQRQISAGQVRPEERSPNGRAQHL